MIRKLQSLGFAVLVTLVVVGGVWFVQALLGNAPW